ncbi:MAG: single-stranded DNA-binding protein [Candidatus Marinimicrobia bacterium]|nr:single-stranded DNA-binding protein [Candidatus Neomarinimicrobiota bacterium]
MSSMNTVLLMGNLTRDPEARTLPSGVKVADLGLAISDKFKNKDGELVERAVFVDVVTWERQAERCAEYLRKGAPVLVEGRLQLDQWQTEGGEKRNKLRVRAHRVQFLGRPGSNGQGDAGSRAPADRSPPEPEEESIFA